MRRIVDYQIVIGFDAHEIGKEVNAALKEGWDLYGNFRFDSGTYRQALVQYEKEWGKETGPR